MDKKNKISAGNKVLAALLAAAACFFGVRGAAAIAAEKQLEERLQHPEEVIDRLFAYVDDTDIEGVESCFTADAAPMTFYNMGSVDEDTVFQSILRQFGRRVIYEVDSVDKLEDQKAEISVSVSYYAVPEAAWQVEMDHLESGSGSRDSEYIKRWEDILASPGHYGGKIRKEAVINFPVVFDEYGKDWKIEALNHEDLEALTDVYYAGISSWADQAGDDYAEAKAESEKAQKESEQAQKKAEQAQKESEQAQRESQQKESEEKAARQQETEDSQPRGGIKMPDDSYVPSYSGGQDRQQEQTPEEEPDNGDVEDYYEDYGDEYDNYDDAADDYEDNEDW